VEGGRLNDRARKGALLDEGTEKARLDRLEGSPDDVLAIRQASTRVRVEKPPSQAEAGRNTKCAIDEPASSIEDPLFALFIKLPDLPQRIIRLVDPGGGTCR
jgi:hypothetical protein